MTRKQALQLHWKNKESANNAIRHHNSLKKGKKKAFIYRGKPHVENIFFCSKREKQKVTDRITFWTLFTLVTQERNGL